MCSTADAIATYVGIDAIGKGWFDYYSTGADSERWDYLAVAQNDLSTRKIASSWAGYAPGNGGPS